MEQPNEAWIPHPSQAKIIDDRHRFRVMRCGRRFGKTLTILDEINTFLAWKPARIAFIATTYQQARDIMWKELLAKLNNQGRINETRLEVSFAGREVVLRGWENIMTLRGQSFDFLCLDEVASMRNFWVNWQEVLRPTLADTKGEAMFASTPNGFNHFYDLCNLELTDPDFKTFHFSTYDNPFIPPEEIEAMRKQMTPERFSQEIMAEFTKTEGLVYKEFSRDKHIFKEHQGSYREIISGVDFGFTNPAACYAIGVDSSDRYFVYDEFYRRGKTDAEVAEYVAAKRFDKVYPDPESAGAIEEMTRRGVNVREVIKGKDSIKNGISVVRELLKSNHLFIHSSCINLISEFEMYSYPEKKDLHNENENPIDENNHGLDAIRYALMMHSSREQSQRMNVYVPDLEL